MPEPFGQGCVRACPHCRVTVQFVGLTVSVDAPRMVRALHSAGHATASLVQAGRFVGAVGKPPMK